MQAAPWAVVGSSQPLREPDRSCCHTGKFGNDCPSNWLGYASDDTDEAVQLAIRAIGGKVGGVI